MNTKNIDIEFLENKNKFEFEVGWGAGVRALHCTSGNSYRLSEDVFSFIEYNELPVDGRTLDGHYEMHVNYKTFEYRINQHSYFGSLTYTTPAREIGWKVLNDKDRAYVEARIAAKLLGMYFFDHNAVNMNGANLFSNDRKEQAGTDYTPNRIRYFDGNKCSLICDCDTWWDLNEHQKLAVQELQH